MLVNLFPLHAVADGSMRISNAIPAVVARLLPYRAALLEFRPHRDISHKVPPDWASHVRLVVEANEFRGIESNMNVQNLPAPEDIEAVLGLDRRSSRRRWLKRAIWSLVLSALLAAAGWYAFSVSRTSQTIIHETKPTARLDLTVTVTATGTLQPTTQVDVSSEMSGVIRSVNVDNNSEVKRGDVLAELDAVRLNAQLTRAEATLAATEARLLDAKATLEERRIAMRRAETLQKKGISAAQELDTAKAAEARAAAGVVAAEADIAVAKADISMQQADIAKTRILSPVDGIVLKRAAEPGQTVASSLQAPILFTLAENLTKMRLEAAVDEADIGAVKEGQKASFTVDAYPGKSFPALIEEIEYSPTVTENVVTYLAILAVDNRDLLLRPGMTATANIVTEEIADALTVPNAALRYQPIPEASSKPFSITAIFMPRPPRPERQVSTTPVNGERKIWVLRNGGPAEVQVKTGASDGQNTAILSGNLQEGDAVIVSSRKTGK
jgi:HlyD family secretion protein